MAPVVAVALKLLLSRLSEDPVWKRASCVAQAMHKVMLLSFQDCRHQFHPPLFLQNLLAMDNVLDTRDMLQGTWNIITLDTHDMFPGT